MEKDNGKYYAVLRVRDPNNDLDHEAIMDALKDSVFVVTFTFEDQGGIGSDVKDTLIVKKIAVTDVNEKPVIAGKDTTITISENLENGKEAGRVPAKDPDTVHPNEYAVLTYSIIDENIPFEMKNGSEIIIVTNADTLNYEALKPDTVFSERHLMRHMT